MQEPRQTTPHTPWVLAKDDCNFDGCPGFELTADPQWVRVTGYDPADPTRTRELSVLVRRSLMHRAADADR